MDAYVSSLARKYGAESTDANAHKVARAVLQSSRRKEHKILISGGFGAGWSTWGPEHADVMLTWAPLIEAVEAEEEISEEHPAVQSMLAHIAEQTGEEDAYVCVSGAGQLSVEVVTGPFSVEEYDGSESVRRMEHLSWPF